jgi:hypothetical protein
MPQNHRKRQSPASSAPLIAGHKARSAPRSTGRTVGDPTLPPPLSVDLPARPHAGLFRLCSLHRYRGALAGGRAGGRDRLDLKTGILSSQHYGRSICSLMMR